EAWQRVNELSEQLSQSWPVAGPQSDSPWRGVCVEKYGHQYRSQLGMEVTRARELARSLGDCLRQTAQQLGQSAPRRPRESPSWFEFCELVVTAPPVSANALRSGADALRNDVAAAQEAVNKLHSLERSVA